MSQKSGLQKDVLALFRRYAPKFRAFLTYNFHTQANSVSSRDVAAIEHLLRKGKRQIEMLEHPSIKDCYVSQTMLEWNTARYRGSS
ncbi:hypothetical protein CONPUDRAFT_123766 [Coniophora puteana RWD-64-598 SS2]|uniref:Uncharacterized protein n=1 Tax=Coniophora puteana (strain RWD-64-598) TaxID=741705 RepID=A0A5M3MP50_CONPW|nr:uncharacterized protein CONPUDRAFT_123766 [Coniophora puteana RWD-64-598 SS2]EIW80952.1 hypothetical protein CONPUDRAFT_123766 [Coniophora puteana RWD-64-598 SS2]